MNEIIKQWRPYTWPLWPEPLDEHLPTPAQMQKSWMRQHAHGLWMWDLHAGYDWNVSTAYDQWVQLALREGWIERDPLAEP
jgi:hypothetical protein